MKIAQISPLYESVPPKLYGGTERVVSYLTEELVRQGHEVTLFASGDSETRAKLLSPCAESLRLNKQCEDQLVYHMLLMEMVQREIEIFDILHFHIDYLHFPFSRKNSKIHVTTLHGRLDIPDLIPLYQEFTEMPVVSISRVQRDPLPWINWQRTIHHGLPEDLYQLYPEEGKYLAFLGRISPEKKVERAIEIAKRSGIPLKIAAKVDKADIEYFKDTIQPLLGHPLIEFLGEISEKDKGDFLGNAIALLFPIDWAEPFGLVMIESMACGTPVIAYKMGSVPEIITEGVSGSIVNSIEEAVSAVDKINTISRKGCRSEFEQRFTVGTMASNYIRLYETLIAQNKKSSRMYIAS